MRTKISFLLIVVLVSYFAPMQVMAEQGQLKHSAAKQAYMIDYDTGMVLFEKNAEEKMAPSSMSKVMTMYVIFGALREGSLSLKNTLKVSEKAWRKGGSKMFVEVGDRVKTEDLVQGVIVQSGNDATIVLAEGLAGSEAAFAEVMNDHAKMLGMKSTHFVNASGWPDKDHYSTAKDLGILARHMIQQYPEYYHYYSQKEFSYNNIRQRNRNPLLYRDMGVDGIKTGHTEDGGYGLMASGMRDGRRVILVVNGLDSEKARAQEGARLMEWGLKGFENINLFVDGETVDHIPVVMGKKQQVPVIVKQDIAVTVPSTLKNDLKVEMVFDGPLEAPIEINQKIGYLRISVPRLKTFEVPLFTAENIEHLGLISSAVAKAKLLLDQRGK